MAQGVKVLVAQGWQLEFYPWNSRWKEKTAPRSCPLASMFMLHRITGFFRTLPRSFFSLQVLQDWNNDYILEQYKVSFIFFFFSYFIWHLFCSNVWEHLPHFAPHGATSRTPRGARAPVGMVLTLSKVIAVEGLNGNHLLEHRQLSAPALPWLPEHELSKTGGAAVWGFLNCSGKPSAQPCPVCVLTKLASLCCFQDSQGQELDEASIFTFCPFLGHLGISVHSVALLVIVSMSVPKSKAVVSWQYHKDSDLSWYPFFSLDILTRPKTFSHRTRFTFPSVYSNEWGNLRVIFIWVSHTGPVL